MENENNIKRRISNELGISEDELKSKLKLFGILLGVIFIFAVVIVLVNGSNTETNTETNINNTSEDTSKKVYRLGYSDGQMGYGLPATDVATSMESYMAHGYNFSSVDVYVYEMGYYDGLYGRSIRY